MPRKARYLWLLGASYYFYMCWNAGYALLILASTVVTWLCGMGLSAVAEGSKSRGRRKAILAAGLCFNFGMLIWFKYAGFLAETVTWLGSVMGIAITLPEVDILLPVGISFFTFQAVGYVIDVYRGTVAAERNFFRYALFVSFFPQLVAGPIERSGKLLGQLREPERFSYDSFREGILLMIKGFFLKIVVADRIAVFVDCVYGNPEAWPGWYLIVGTVLFGIQIYCDFAGYTTIAMGSARMLGIRLTDNFDAPYLSTSVHDFWRRWHISLTSWFRDYLYIPLGGGRKGAWRKQVNRMIVFLVSGLWHGANVTFLIWGGINGAYQVIGDVLKPARDRAARLLGIRRESLGHRMLCGGITFALITFSWIFFRAQTVEQAGQIVGSIFGARNPWVLIDGSLYACGLDAANFTVMGIGIGILALMDILRRRGIRAERVILRQPCWFRWVWFSVCIAAVLLFGIWGPGYDAASFIYFQF